MNDINLPSGYKEMEKHLNEERNRIYPIIENGPCRVVDVSERISAQELLQISEAKYRAVVENSHDMTEHVLMEQSLRESEDKLRTIFKNMLDGFAYHKMILDEEGNPVDYEYLEVNDAFLRLIEYSGTSIIGKRVTEIFPDIKSENIDWIQTFAQVALQGKNMRLEAYFAALKKWYTVSAFSTTPGFFAVSVNDITQQKEAEIAQDYLLTHDDFTGLYNLSYFEKCLYEKDFSQYLPVSIVVGDMNGLKLANDAFGRSYGDSLIKAIADIIKQVCRSTDIISRWGGDAFAIILPNTGSYETSQLCQQIGDLCNATACGHLKPSIALGFSTKETPDVSIEEVFKIAEDNMYRNKMLQSKSVRNAIISSLETVLYERTQETHDHAERMAKYCEMFQARIHLPAAEMDRLLILAHLHDIGKVGIPDHILNKPGALTPSEWEVIKKHPEIGFRIAQTSLELSSVAEEILSHHERWDGKGYPRGLKGDDIPLLAQIISIIDSYDVMTHARSYKIPMTREQAIEELMHCSGTQFNPVLVREFVSLAR